MITGLDCVAIRRPVNMIGGDKYSVFLMAFDSSFREKGVVRLQKHAEARFQGAESFESASRR